VGGALGGIAAGAAHALSHAFVRPLLAVVAVAALGALGYGAVQTVEVLLRPLPPEAAEIPAALLRSFLRLLLAYAISLAWTIPVACWVSR
jgi:hypothetical protein